jgi:hypothetical protein
VSESKRERSKAYPQFSLDDMLEALKRIHSQLGAGPYSRAAIAEGLGHNVGSGSANAKAAALVHFGLLDREQNAYHLSAISRRIIHPTEEGEVAQAIAEAVKLPTLFAAMFERFGGKSLPQLLPNILARDYGIISKQSSQAAELFRRSAEYAGLLRHGVLHQDLAIDEVVADESKSPTMAKEFQRPSTDVRTATHVRQDVPDQVRKNFDAMAYPIPLSGGRVCILELPRPVTERDLTKIRGWLELMADVLVESSVAEDDRQDVDKKNPEATS